MKFKNGDKVVWDHERWQTGDCENGRVVGYSTTDMPVVGAMAIISVHNPPYRNVLNDTYPYECITLPECALTIGEK